MSKYDELLVSLNAGPRPSPDIVEILRHKAHDVCTIISADLDGVKLDREPLVYDLVVAYFAENPAVFGQVEVFRNRPFPGLTGLACAILGDYDQVAAMYLGIFLERSRVKVFLYPYEGFLT